MDEVLFKYMQLSRATSLFLKFKTIIKNKIPEYLAGLMMNSLNAEYFLPKSLKIKNDSIYFRAKPYDATYYFSGGLRFFTPKDDSLNQHARLGFRYYEPKTRAIANYIAKNLEKNSLIIDVGAYNGVFTIPLSMTSHATFLSFEPNFANFSTLLKNITLNKLQSNILPMYLALSNKNKFGYVTGQNSELSTIFEYHEETLYKQAVFRLDDIVSLLPSMPIRLIKIDVEGMGNEVLEASQISIEKYNPYIIIEALNEAEYRSQASLLKSLGYMSGVSLGNAYGDERNFFFMHQSSYPKLDWDFYDLSKSLQPIK